MRGYSHEILANWKEHTGGREIDFIFIDGSHKYLEVLKDFEMSYPLIKKGGWIAFHDVVYTWPGSERVWHDIAKNILVNHEYCSTLACGQKKSALPEQLPIHFFTIVLNGQPFIRYHIEVFKQLPFKWHWHIIEGVADLKHDTAWSRQFGGHIADELHRNGLSKDGTSEYLDEIARQFPENVTVYRKSGGVFWDGKLEMVNAPLANIREECLLWQVDADELWTVEQICTARQMFINNPDKTAAYYFCWFFVGEGLLIVTRDTYGNNTGYEWLRTWRFKPGFRWATHEPPRLCMPLKNGQWGEVATIKPFKHDETSEKGMVFQHYAYVNKEQLGFKEIYYGYKNATEQWLRLQEHKDFPVFLRDYFAWVKDGSQVNTVQSQNITPLAWKDINGQWQFSSSHLSSEPQPMLPSNNYKNILWVRTDSIGDNVLFSSILPHIRKKFEHARITVLCQEHIAELYESCPCVDDVVVFNKKKAYEDAGYRSEIINHLRVLKPSVSLNSVFSSEPITHIFATECGAGERIAIEGDLCNISAELRQKYNQSYTKLLPSAGEHKPELARHIDFLKGLGVDVPLLETVVWTSQEDENFANEFFQGNNLNQDETIVLFAGAQYDVRLYEKYGTSLSEFCQKNHLKVVALGIGREYDTNQRNLDNIGVETFNLSGKTTIRQSAAMLRRCRMAVGAETGLAHICCAVRAPNVILLGGGHFGRFMPYSPLTSVVCLPLECYGCGWKCGYERPHCVKDIAPQVIAEAIQQSFERTSEKPRVFVQAASMWNSAATGPKWKYFDQLLDTSKVEIVTVGGTQATDKKCSPVIGSNVRRAAARLDRDEYPTISVVTPSYNQKDYLEECICSVLDQGYPNLEYIIMDGGSTDGSVEIIKKYANYLTYWQSKPDGGQYAAINEGFKRTTGEIMTWLNSDDKFHPNAFKTVVSVFMHRKDIGWIIGRPNTFDEQGQQSWIERSLPLWSRERYLKKDYKFIQQEGTFWRRSLWEKAGATLQVNLDLAGDLELWARFFRFARLYTVDALIAGYRYHPGQKAQLFMDKYIEEAEKILDREILLFKEGKYKELLPAPKPILISEIKEFLPSDADEINQQGQELLTKGDLVGALDAFTRAIEIVPNSVLIHNNIGRLYLQKGEPAGALKHFTRALKIDSYDRLTVLNCGQLLAANGRIENARELYWSYLQRHPDDREIVNVLTKLKKDRTVEVPNDKYLVSAIISTYNSERFIRGCLEDLENQTIADRLEIIVVDSGSQQNEGRIVEEFQKKYGNIKYIRNEHREGIYAAWNRAIKLAQGRFITNANTDDRYREDALQQMASELLANPDIVLVYADQIRTNTPNDSFAVHHSMEMLQRPDYSRRRLLFGCCVGSQPMWRKSLHGEFGYFDETLTCAGDWDFWLRISQRYGFKHIPEFLGLYYYNQDGIEHGKKIHSLYERYVVGKRYGIPYISVIPLYQNKNNPLVSVIMPAYNAAEYIAEAIESVLIQNYRNFEFIIVNDGSTDRTEEIIKSFKDEGIRYFLKENSGPSAARNLGIRHARGEFIITFDSDDMVTPDFIARHLQEFQEHPGADMVYCDDCLIDENDKPIRIINRPEYKNRKLLIRDLFRAGFPVVPFRTTCIRKSVFDKIGLFDERLLVAEDYDMVRRFVKNGLNMHHLAEPIYLRRMTPNSLSRKSTAEKAKIHFDVVRRFTDTFTYDELFPDVAWDKIPAGQRQLHARCLAAVTFLAIGQTYVEANSPVCAETAFNQACSDLKECLKVDPDNRLFQQLLHKFELLRTEYQASGQVNALFSDNKDRNCVSSCI